MSNLKNVKGLDQLQKALNQLPAKIEANVMRGALRAGVKPVLHHARSNVSKDSGVLAEGLKIKTRRKGSLITASVAATGPHAHVAKWIEYGTAKHEITGKDGRPLFFGQRFVPLVLHPGTKADPFMRPALDSQATEAVRQAGIYMKKRLSTKHGLDTGHIKLEGDE